MALVAGLAGAAIAVAANDLGGGAPGGGDPAVKVSEAESVASPVASPAPAAASPTVTSATATAPVAIDPSRVVDAERESRRFAEEAQDTEGDGDEALTQQLRDTQYAYRDAAAAAAAGEAGRFTTTLAKADALARSALARLDGDGGDESSGDSGSGEDRDQTGDHGGDEADEDEGDEDGGEDENADHGGDEGGGA